MLNRPTTAVTKRAVVLAGAVLAMIAMLVISSPAPNGIFAHPHDPEQTHTGVAEGAEHIHYAEDAPGPVRDFDSTDPEESTIEWNVRGVDAADFDIDSSTGVLTFIDSPDYESPTDRARAEADLNDDNDQDDPGEEAFVAGDNNYQITVSATEMSDALPAKRTDIDLTVVVDNADDKGELTLEWLQPEVDVEIGTTLTDPDTETDPVGEITDEAWTWYISKATEPVIGEDSHWNVIADANDATYTPVAANEGRYLWVHVAYTDPQGDTKTADEKSENPVRAAVSAGANASPDFPDVTDTRTVPESTAVGDPVGAPVTATDADDADKDRLTYELVKVAAPNDGDDEFFDIDMATGQITVAQNLDYDAVGGRTAGATAGEYIVIVRVTDPSSSTNDIEVTITAENVNEAPMVTGRAELSVAEGTIDITDEDAVLVYTTLPDAPTGTNPNPTGQRNEYLYEDPDHLDSIARWTLEGDDAGAFDQSGDFEPRYIQFTVAPDFENPTDMNRDNVYEVTLVATDTDPLGTGAGVGRVKVWLTVNNVNEAGMVVFTEGETAFQDEMLVAEVQDPDDHGGDMGEPYEGVHIVNWQWSRSEHEADDADPFMDIVGATTNTYTPKVSDRGFFLRATARYTDPLRTEDLPGTEIDERLTPDDPNTEAVDGSLRVEMATTENAVRVAPGPESAPTFDETGDETGAVTRKVAENTAPGGNVGAPVAAMAANVDEELEYTLEGSDAKYFNISSMAGNMGQITVGGDDPSTTEVTELGTDPELNYDPPDNHRMFSVTVKVEVTGGEANQKAEVDVVIMVTDVDEEPKITDEDVDAAPMIAIMYAEIGEDDAPNTAAVATYVGTDPEGDSISWDLRGADAALFTIDGGVLKFRNAPDYENPRDMDGDLTDGDHTDQDGDTIQDDEVDDTVTPDAVAGNNVYDIVIRAIASRDSGDTGPAETVDTTVAVTVTDVDEEGEVVISWLQPEVGTEIMASLTDPDGGVVDISWQWEVSKIGVNDLDIDNTDHWGIAPGDGDTEDGYTPTGADLTDNPGVTDNDDPIDEDKFLRVTAEYRDTNGEDKTARAMSAYPVQARDLGAKNDSPDFKGDKVELSVAETAEVGANVGAAVRAPVGGSPGRDRLTYGLRAVVTGTGVDADAMPDGVTAPADDAAAAADVAAFDIDKATGQITVAQELDFESRGPVDDTKDRDGKYVVVATVTDPSGLPDTIVVVITAEDINEDPVLSGRPELTIMEIDSGDEDADNPDFDGNPVPPTEPIPTVNVYNVVDEDRRAATNEWSLEGEDKEQFQLIGNVGRTLVFRNQPDYENPADDDGDNVYKVTIVTLDGDGGRGEFDVCIAVMNINEAGKITLLDEDGNKLVQPRALGSITAELTDPDGGVTGLTWQWAKSEDDPPQSPDPQDITTATSATFTPTNDDTGDYLRVTAMYMDELSAADVAAGGQGDGDRTAEATAPHAVLEVLDLKRAPAFPADATEVEVAENSPSTTYVGEAIVAAVDPDKGTTLTYTLEDEDGEEAKFFKLVALPVLDEQGDPVNDDEGNPMMVNTRQIVVADPMLRAGTGDGSDPFMAAMYDPTDLDKEDDKKNSYTVVLKASDGNEETDDATLTVTITVTDRNEAPSTPMAATDDAVTPPTPENNAPMFPDTEDGMRSVAENTAAGENIGAAVMATDDDAGDTLMYTLGGADMASFAIDSGTGQLKTMAPLDFEMMPSYTVEVMADDGNGGTDTIEVTISVEDVSLGTVADTYDANSNEVIGGAEVAKAVQDYFNGDLGGGAVAGVVQLYFAGRSS